MTNAFLLAKEDKKQRAIEAIVLREYELNPTRYFDKYGYHRFENMPPLMKSELLEEAKRVLYYLHLPELREYYEEVLGK